MRIIAWCFFVGIKRHYNPYICGIMARLMAFDYGQKRTGIAVTDELKIIATALDTVLTADAFEYIKKYLLTNSIEAFVIGKPLQMNGEASESMAGAKLFAEGLKKDFPAIPQHWQDERFTSQLAQNAMWQSGANKKARHEKGAIDRVSATIILQNFMEQM